MSVLRGAIIPPQYDKISLKFISNGGCHACVSHVNLNSCNLLRHCIPDRNFTLLMPVRRNARDSVGIVNFLIARKSLGLQNFRITYDAACNFLQSSKHRGTLWWVPAPFRVHELMQFYTNFICVIKNNKNVNSWM